MTGGAVIYTRVSSEEQTHGTSLDTQERDCRAAAARLGLDVLAVETDAGKSAKSVVGRDGLARAVSRCRKAGAALIVYKFDRLARNAVDALAVRDALLARGCQIVSATEGEATATPVARALFGMASVFAELDNAMRSERSRGGMAARAAQGGYVHRAPVGFKNARNSQGIPVLVPDEPAASVMRGVFQGLADGSLSTPAAVREVMGLGLTRAAAFLALRNPVYAGVISGKLTGAGEIRAAFPGLVSREVFDAAGARFATRKGEVKMKENPRTPLVGVLFCAECGKTLVGGLSTSRNGSRHGYYRCRHGHCAISFVDAEKAVKGILARLTDCRPFLSLLRANLEAFAGQGDELEDAEVKKARASIPRDEARLRRAREAYLDGVFGTGEYERTRRELEASLQEARTVIVTHEKMAQRRSDAVTALLEVAASPERVLTLPRPALRDLFRILFGRLEVTRGKMVEPRKDSPYAALLEAAQGESNMVGLISGMLNRFADGADALRAAVDGMKSSTKSA